VTGGCNVVGGVPDESEVAVADEAAIAAAEEHAAHLEEQRFNGWKD